MDGRKNPFSLPDHDETIDADTAQVATGVRRRTIPDDEIAARDPNESQLIESQVVERQVVVFCGDQQQVNEGFAIALRVMGLDADFLRGDIPPTAIHPNRETTK
jgi:hypothetical protein